MAKINIDNPLCQCGCHWSSSCNVNHTPCCNIAKKRYNGEMMTQASHENFYLWLVDALSHRSIASDQGRLFIMSLIREIRHYIKIVND